LGLAGTNLPLGKPPALPEVSDSWKTKAAHVHEHVHDNDHVDVDEDVRVLVDMGGFSDTRRICETEVC
jgi:hypothetical protein